MFRWFANGASASATHPAANGERNAAFANTNKVPKLDYRRTDSLYRNDRRPGARKSSHANTHAAYAVDEVKMTMLNIAQLGISVFGLAAFLLVTRESRRCQILGTVFGLLSNPFWWLMVFATEQWLTVPLHAGYTYGWLSKAIRLYRAAKS